MRQTGELPQVETREHGVGEHAGDENRCDGGRNYRSYETRASHAPPTTAARIVKNGRVRGTHGSLDDSKVSLMLRDNKKAVHDQDRGRLR